MCWNYSMHCEIEQAGQPRPHPARVCVAGGGGKGRRFLPFLTLWRFFSATPANQRGVGTDVGSVGLEGDHEASESAFGRYISILIKVSRYQNGSRPACPLVGSEGHFKKKYLFGLNKKISTYVNISGLGNVKNNVFA